MDKFKEKFYKILIDNNNFYIKQYYSDFHKEEMYIAVKELEDGIYCVIISGEEEVQIDIEEALEFIKSLGKKFSLNAIIFSNGEHEDKFSNSLLGVNKLVINKKSNQVILCDNPCMPLKYIFENLMKKNIESSGEKYNFLKYKVLTVAIIIINIIIFIITQIVIYNITKSNMNNIMDIAQTYPANQRAEIISQMKNNISNSVLISFGAKYNQLINSGQIWRLITCAFLHSNLIHIACNMYSIYIVGPQIEQIYGKIKYLVIYFISCITASLLSYFMSPNGISVGASGGIFGLLGALLAFAIVERNKMQKKYISSLLQVIAVNLFIGMSVQNIDNFAHVGGLIGGMVIGYISYRLIIKAKSNK